MALINNKLSIADGCSLEGEYMTGSGNLLKVSFRCSDNDRKNLANTNCLLTISVGQKPHEGKYLYSTIKAISRKNFNSCTIMVCDTLQRHTMKLMDMSQDFTKQSYQLGTNWIERNQKYFNELAIPFHFVRWNSWLDHNRFKYYDSIVTELSQTSQEFSRSLHKEGMQFYNRIKKRIPNISKKACLQQSKIYLLEECAAMLIYVEEDFHFDIYPSKRNVALEIIYQNLIEPTQPEKLRPIALNFKGKVNRTVHEGCVNV